MSTEIAATVGRRPLAPGARAPGAAAQPDLLDESLKQRREESRPGDSAPRPPQESSSGQREPSSGEEDDIGDPPPTPRAPLWLLLALFALGAAGVAGMFAFGWAPRARQQAALDAEVERARHALPRVLVQHPRRSPAIAAKTLPGDVQALEETTVYPRTSGYLKRWLVDIGDEVQAGDLLAEIDTPEVDQELRQAHATLGQLRAKLLTAEANLRLAETTLKRYHALRDNKAVSYQEIDEREAAAETARSTVAAAKADVAAGEANVQRLTELHAFAKVYAPFAGTITARTIESGHLVSSGNGLAQSLFRLAKTDPARVFVHVPQMYSVGVKVGLSAELIVREMPHRKFVGQVTRTARAIDPATRTLLTEIRVPNGDHALLTGSYVQVRMSIERENPPLLLPAAALIVNAEGTSLATLDSQRQVHFRPVVVEGDFGGDVGISSGVSADDLVVINPSERLSEGGRVEIEANPVVRTKKEDTLFGRPLLAREKNAKH